MGCRHPRPAEPAPRQWPRPRASAFPATSAVQVLRYNRQSLRARSARRLRPHPAGPGVCRWWSRGRGPGWGARSGRQHPVELILEMGALLAHLDLGQFLDRLDVGFRTVHGAVDLVILVGQAREMRVTGLELGDLLGVLGEFFVQLMGGMG